MSFHFQCFSCFVWRAKIGSSETMRIRKKKRWQTEERWTANKNHSRDVEGCLLYKEHSSWTERGVFTQRDCILCRLRLNWKVLAGEELCTDTAPDKHACMWVVESMKMGKLEVKAFCWTHIMHVTCINSCTNGYTQKFERFYRPSSGKSAHIGMVFNLVLPARQVEANLFFPVVSPSFKSLRPQK